MEEFSLEKYLKNPNRKVVTRDGKSVRIVCTDLKGTEFPIIALYEDGEHECFDTYRPNGRSCDYYEFDNDLFFASENEKEKHNAGNIRYSNFTIYNTKKEAKKERGNRCVTTVKIEWEE